METLEFLKAELENVNEKLKIYIQNGYGLKNVTTEREVIIRLIKKFERLQDEEEIENFDEEEA